MEGDVDPRHLMGLVGSAGRSIAQASGAGETVARLRAARSPDELQALLAPLDLGLEPPARGLVIAALGDKARWEALQAALARSAEQALAERFSSGA